MHLYIAATQTQPDYVALAMVLALAAVTAVMAIRKKIAMGKTVPVTVEAVAGEASPAPKAPGTAGELKLHDVPPRTAAMVMAIVASQTGKPLNELRFISIKEVKE